jgi:hypothetical protein
MSGRYPFILTSSTGVIYVMIESKYRTRNRNSTSYRHKLMIIIDHVARSGASDVGGYPNGGFAALDHQLPGQRGQTHPSQ